MTAVQRVGLISDTHDMLRPQALDFLRGCDCIVHAGDICGPAVLEALRALAPLTAVRGNNDVGAWADDLQEVASLDVAGVRLLVIHDLKQLDRARLAPDVRAVIAGHSHRPGVEERSGVLYINPGSAGPRRFKLPISVGDIMIESGHLTARTVELRVQA